MLHDQEAVVVLLQDGHELKDGEGAAHFQFRDVSVQPAEDAGVVAADEEDLVALQFQVAALALPVVFPDLGLGWRINSEAPGPEIAISRQELADEVLDLLTSMRDTYK